LARLKGIRETYAHGYVDTEPKKMSGKINVPRAYESPAFF
jgi:hypothetical protein